jgi:hypothetical protein
MHALCKKELDFGVPIYCYATRMGHADSMDEAYELAVQRMVEGLADLTADIYLAGKLPALKPVPGTGVAVGDLKPTKRKKRGRKAPSKQYLQRRLELRDSPATNHRMTKPSYSFEGP